MRTQGGILNVCTGLMGWLTIRVLDGLARQALYPAASDRCGGYCAYTQEYQRVDLVWFVVSRYAGRNVLRNWAISALQNQRAMPSKRYLSLSIK